MATKRGDEYSYTIAGKNKSRTATRQAGKDLDGLRKKAHELSATFDHVTNLGGKAIRMFKGMATAMSVPIQLAAEQQRVEKQLAAVLESTAGAADLTARAAKDLASSYQNLTTFGDEVIIGAENMLLTFTNVSGKNGIFQRAIGTTLDLATAMDQSLKESVMKVGKALNDPIRGVSELREVGISFSDAQIEMITALAETNRLAEAQTLILDELDRQFGGSAEAARDTFGGAVKSLENAWGDLLEQLGMVVTESPIVREALAGVTDVIAEMTEGLATGEGHWGGFRKAADEFVSGTVPSILRGTASLIIGFEETFKAIQSIGGALLDHAFGLVDEIIVALGDLLETDGATENATAARLRELAAELEALGSSADAAKESMTAFEAELKGFFGEAFGALDDQFQELADELLKISALAGDEVVLQAQKDVEQLRAIFEEGFQVSDAMGFQAYEYALEQLQDMITAAQAVVDQHGAQMPSTPQPAGQLPFEFGDMVPAIMGAMDGVGERFRSFHDQRMQAEAEYQAELHRDSQIMLYGLQSVFSSAAGGFERLGDAWKRFGMSARAQMSDALLDPIFGAQSALNDLFKPIFGLLRSLGQAVHDALIKPLVNGITGFFSDWIAGEAAVAEASTGVHAAAAAATTGTTLGAVATMMPGLSAAATAALIATFGGAASAAALYPGLLAQAQAQGLSAVAFAQGGEVTAPTYALIGEDGRELVIPETKPARAQSLIGDLYDRNPGLFSRVGGQGGGAIINVTVNAAPGQSELAIGHEVARILDERLGRSL